MPRSFILKDAEYALLTYPQVPEALQEGFPDAITDLISSGPILAEFTAARELHRDGGIHFHVFVDFGRKFSSRRTDVFDCLGRHPNIERVGRTPRVAYDYAIKDGDIVAGICEPPPGPDGSGEGGLQRSRGEGEPGSNWSRIVLAETRELFFERVRELEPKSLVCSFVSLSRYADWQYRAIPEPYSHPDGWTFQLDRYPILLDWVDECLRGGEER